MNSPAQRKEDRRKALNRHEDRIREHAKNETIRKLHSLLELGQLIGLDLHLDEMLLKIAQKVCEVIESDRCSIFLHDPATNELWSKVALGMGGKVIRIPCGQGVAGHCFANGETINLSDAYTDPRFDQTVDARTGYRTRSLFSLPIYKHDGFKLGVLQLLNKKDGVFTKEDEEFLKTFANHASVFIEMAQLQKARLDALEQSRRELEQLNRVKSKALDHLSHELRTPLAVIQANFRLLKRKLSMAALSVQWEELFAPMEKHLDRILAIQQETDEIIRSYQGLKEIRNEFHEASYTPEVLFFLPFTEKVIEKVRQRAAHRDIHFQLEGAKEHPLFMDPNILEDILEGLLKNAVENTPDEGMIRVLWEQKNGSICLHIHDFGIGINEENQKYVFDGLFHTQDTELYTSKSPYDFNAGGKGLDLLRMKVYGQRFGFDLSFVSNRCIYLPMDRDLCPGQIALCPHCHKPADCLSSGGSVFTVSFPINLGRFLEKSIIGDAVEGTEAL